MANVTIMQHVLPDIQAYSRTEFECIVKEMRAEYRSKGLPSWSKFINIISRSYANNHVPCLWSRLPLRGVEIRNLMLTSQSSFLTE